MVTSPAPPQLTPGTGQPSFFHPNLTHPPSFSQRKPPSLQSQHPPEKPLGAGWSQHSFLSGFGPAGHKFLLLCSREGTSCSVPFCSGAAPRVTRISRFVPLEILPSWGLEMSQGPSVPPWEGEVGRHGGDALRAFAVFVGIFLILLLEGYFKSRFCFSTEQAAS